MTKKEYESSRVAIDATIFTVSEDSLKIYLKKREKEPFKDKLEHVGGLLLKDETAEETLRRKVTDTIPVEEAIRLLENMKSSELKYLQQLRKSSSEKIKGDNKLQW